ncbi:MAG: hypothetical protein JSV62_01465 [Promethearchaeota archaeon]|nr:MAG: hypothetical protein JSV62_01465 [Candidatus Lokiarchaeota archaeon]
MALSEDNKLFRCPKCGNTGTIFFLKPMGKKIVIKQKCPQHGDRSFKIPIMKKNQFIQDFRHGIFQCPNCGKETTVERAKPSGSWMVVKCVCPTHGNKLPPQKIWSTIYIDVINKEISTPQGVEQVNNQINKSKLCPNCKTPIKGTEKYCDTCGAQIA